MSRAVTNIGAVVSLAAIAAAETPTPPPYVIRKDADWVAATPCTAVAPGSALDFSRFGFAEGPCGKFGRIVARGEHFEYENRPGVPLRFMGVNFCESGNYLPSDDSRKLVENLVRLGYNSIRLHHHDDAWAKALVRRESPVPDFRLPVPDGGGADDPTEAKGDDAIARLDTLMAACREKGVYVTTDLYVSRMVPWRDIGEARDGNIPMGDFKVLLHFHDGALSNYLAYARAFLGHVNSLTGLRYADDPTLAWISLVNEGNLGNWDIGPYKKFESLVLPKWRAWLAARRAENPEYASVPDTLPAAVLEIPKDDRVVAFDNAPDANAGVFTAKAHVLAFQQFLASLEADFLARMRSFLRDEIGCRALVTNMNGWRFMAAEQPVRASFDYVDDHFYYAHPAFLGPNWTLPARLAGESPTNIGYADEFGVPYGVTRRLFGHPFTISEYNYCPPWEHRASCAFLLGATAALQDWSALWRFCWTCSALGAVDSSKKSLNHFDMAGDPVATMTERAVFCLFLRRDLPELSAVYPRIYPPSEIARLDGVSEDPTSCHVRWAAWRAKVGGLVTQTPPDGMTIFSRFPVPNRMKTQHDVAHDLGTDFCDLVESPNGSVRVDRKRGMIAVDTPRTTGGFVEKDGIIETRGFRAKVEGGTASVWVSSLSDRPIVESDHLLACLIGDIQNDGIEYEDATRCVLRGWGKREGRIARRVAADLSVVLDAAPKWQVYALNPDGTRKRELPSTFRDGRLHFRADIGGDLDEAEFCYELTARRNP